MKQTYTSTAIPSLFLLLLASCASSLESQESALMAVPDSKVLKSPIEAAKKGPVARLVPEEEIDISLSEKDSLVFIDSSAGKRVPYKVVEFVPSQAGKWRFHLSAKSQASGFGSGAVVVPGVLIFDEAFEELNGRLVRDSVGRDGVFDSMGYKMEFEVELPRAGKLRLFIFPDLQSVDVALRELPGGAIRGHIFGPMTIRAKLVRRGN